MTWNREVVKELLEKYPLPSSDYRFTYGTAGFRDKADFHMDAVMVRVGFLATIRAAQWQQDVGVVITASHNDESYNGVKIADPNGGMMGRTGEAMAVQFVNERDNNQVIHFLSESQQRKVVPKPTVVHIGRDTRTHSAAFSELVARAVEAMGGRVEQHGIVTTPMLHHAVLHANAPFHLPVEITYRPGISGYYEMLVQSYRSLILLSSPTASASSFERMNPPLVVDCACGVGYGHVRALASKIRQVQESDDDEHNSKKYHARLTQLIPVNGPGMGPLNDGCGSEHVQKGLQPPHWYGNAVPDNTSYCASLDGDADRIVFFSLPKNNKDGSANFQLLDGDKIACLVATFVKEQLSTILAGLPAMSTFMPKLGVVQTAYANGASTKYLQTLLGTDHVLIAKTGVKHVHAAAIANFDIGIYFEANGHGTVLFSSKFYNFLHECKEQLQKQQELAIDHYADAKGSSTSPVTTNAASGATKGDLLVLEASVALQRLLVLPSLVNQAVGDALSDLLLVDAILDIKRWSVNDWMGRLYQDFPSRQCKVKVADRTMIRTNENETKCVQPIELQNELDKLVEKYNNSRAFCRPSGTEDVVRVYAEGSTREAADMLASEAAETVYRLCDGKGDLPNFPPSSRI